jgi:hypothetical protein
LGDPTEVSRFTLLTPTNKMAAVLSNKQEVSSAPHGEFDPMFHLARKPFTLHFFPLFLFVKSQF